jgi:Mobilization protein NikA
LLKWLGMEPRSLRSRAADDTTDGLLRSYVLSVRLTPAERMRVQEAAHALGISAGQFARLRTLGQPLPAPRPPRAAISDINVAAYRQLGAIGNNLNQLARHFNLRAGDDPEAAEVLAEIHALIPLVRDTQRLLLGRTP